MNIKKMAYSLIVIFGIFFSLNLSSIKSVNTIDHKMLKAITREVATIFTVDRKMDGSVMPESPLYINLSQKNLSDTSFFQNKQFQNLVIEQYGSLTGKFVEILDQIPVEINIAHNRIQRLDPKTFNNYMVIALTLDEQNMSDEAITNLTSYNNAMIIWE